jgi:hypothetical protein
MADAGANFDIQGFQREVIAAVRDVELFDERSKTKVRPRARGRFPGPPRTRFVDYSPRYRLEPKQPKRSALNKQREKELKATARAYLRRKSFRELLCRELKGIKGPAWWISRRLVVILVPLSLVGAISIPLDAYLFAMIAILVAKVGIDSLCDHER